MNNSRLPGLHYDFARRYEKNLAAVKYFGDSRRIGKAIDQRG